MDSICNKVASPSKNMASPQKKMPSPSKTMSSPRKKMPLPSKKIVSPSKKGDRSLSFTWDNDSTKVLLHLCLEFQLSHNRKQQFKWPEIIQKFEERTGRHASATTLRNKLETMKKHFQLWTRLKGSETGLGLNPVTGQIEADSVWWDMKIKENSEFKRFRNKGVPPDIEDLWEQLFGDSYATGEHCVVPGMDVPAMSTPHDSSYNQPHHSSQHESIMEDSEDLANELQRLNTNSYDLGGSSPPTPVTTPSDSTSKRMSEEPGSTNLGGSKRPRLSRGAAAFQDTVQDLKTEGRRAYDLIANVCSSLTSPPTVVPEDPDKQVRDAFELLYQMVDEGLLEATSDVFCFATTKILDANGRKGFMYLKSNSHRLAWLKFEMKKN